MTEMTILKSLIEVMATDKAGIIATSISHSLLLAGIVYSVIHLVKMMFEPVEKDIEFEEPIAEIEKLIS